MHMGFMHDDRLEFTPNHTGAPRELAEVLGRGGLGNFTCTWAGRPALAIVLLWRIGPEFTHNCTGAPHELADVFVLNCN